MTDISGSNTVSDGSNGLYTPTTEEVKESYFDWNGGNGVESPIGLYEEFDRWLAEVKAQERKAERKRALSIIMTNIGQIVWQARHNPEGEGIDMTKMYEAIMGKDNG